MTLHSNYWSCSRFADWLRGTPKLKAGTGDEWDDWRDSAKSRSAVRYWLAEEGLDYIQDFVTWPADRLNDVRYYINNRWVSRTHSLTAHPRDIRPGQWCDVGNRFLPCLFNELVDFVEIEQAWHHVLWDEEQRKKYQPPWWRRGWLRWRTWRCPEAGIAHLKWASSLTWGDDEFLDKDDERYGKFTHQALAAQEILELYTWWKEVYPNRPDVHDASGWSAYCEKRRLANPGGSLFSDRGETKELKRECKKALALCQKIEKQYREEDEAMMIRLIKIRESLWT